VNSHNIEEGRLRQLARLFTDLIDAKSATALRSHVMQALTQWPPAEELHRRSLLEIHQQMMEQAQENFLETMSDNDLNKAASLIPGLRDLTLYNEACRGHGAGAAHSDGA